MTVRLVPVALDERWVGRWLVALSAVAAGVAMFVLSFTFFDQDTSSTLLFFGGLAVVVASGALAGYRSVVLSFCIPVVLVLLFPEHGEPAPADQGGCDPFCSDPVAGVAWAIGLGIFGAVLALVGWGAAAAFRLTRGLRNRGRP